MSNGMLKKYYQFELGQVCSRLSSGKGIAAKEISEHGIYPVFGGNGLRGYSDKKNFEGQCAIIGRQGAFCGNVRFFSGEAYMTEHAVVVCANEKSDIKYLSYLLGTMNLGRLSGQSAQPGLSVKTLSKQVIQLPDISEQRQITKVLSSFDDKIELNAQINHNLEEQAKAIFKSWFVDFEPFQNGKFVDSELGKIPEGWRVLNFTDVIQILGGGTPKTSQEDFWDGDIPFFTPKDVGNSIYVTHTEKTLTQAGIDNCNSKLYPINTVFVTARGTVGKIALAGVPMAMNQSCYALVGKNISSFFILHLTYQTINRLKNKASGAVFDAIVTRDFDSEQIIFPPTEIIEKFVALVQNMYEHIRNNELQQIKLAQMRDTLLPKLMSGEIDVLEV